MADRENEQHGNETTVQSGDVDLGKPAAADINTLADVPDSAATGAERERSPETILDVAQGTTGLLGAGRPASENLFEE